MQFGVFNLKMLKYLDYIQNIPQTNEVGLPLQNNYKLNTINY